MKAPFTPGTLVRLKINTLNYAPAGFMTISKRGDTFAIYETIDLNSYPSTDDFHGSTTSVTDGEHAMILAHVGRPFRIPKDPTWFSYDVYRILIRGKTRMVFSQNIEVLI